MTAKGKINSNSQQRKNLVVLHFYEHFFVCECEKKQTAINLQLFLLKAIVIRMENCIFTAKLSDDDGEVDVEEIMRNLERKKISKKV